MRTIRQLGDLAGRTALITGGTGHIGAVVSAGLAEMGATAVIVDRDAVACEKVAASLGRSAWGCACDLSDEADTRAMVREVIVRAGGLDIFVHAAAFVGTTAIPGWGVPFEQQSVAAWDSALRVNLTAPFIVVQEARLALRASGRGSVVLFSSTYGMVGPDFSLYEGTNMANPAGYGASKGGVLQLMKYLATNLAPYVRVNAVSPGGVWRQQPNIFRQRYEARTPLGRMATEEDLKGAVAYLASDLSSYVTGHNLVVDGGWTVW